MLSSTQYDCECTVNESEFFEPVMKQVTLEKGQWVDVYPLNNVSSDGPIEFTINGSTDEFIDLNNTMLQINCKIKNAAGNKDLIANELVAPVNNWLHSMFSDVMLTLSNDVVEGGDHHYPYKAYLTNLLMHNQGSKRTQLASSAWYKDTADKMETGTATENKGFDSRKDLTALSAEVELCGPLLLDLTLQNKYMLHNTDIGIKLIRSKPSFQVMIKTATLADKSTAVNIEILKAVLHVRRVKALPSVINSIEEKLNFQNAVIPLQRTEMVTYSIPVGSLSHYKEALFRGQMPKLVIAGIVRNDSYNGSYATNPFNFMHCNVNYMALYREGEAIPFRQPFQPRFSDKICTREYMSFIQSLDLFNKSEDNDITLHEYMNGYTLYAFNLTPNLNIAGSAQTERDGNLRLEIKFSSSLAQAVNVIVMGIFDGRIEITKHRNVITDWKA